MLLGDRMAIGAGGEEGEFVARLGHRQPFGIGPGIPALLLAEGDLRIHEGLHLEIFRRAERLGKFNQLGERKAAPGNRHAPGFDAAMPIGALLDAHLANEIVDADLERLFHHAVDLDRPRPRIQRLRRAGDGLLLAEFVEIIIVAVDLLVGDWPVEFVFGVELGRVKIGGRVRQRRDIGDALRLRRHRRQRHGRQGHGRRAADQQLAPVEGKVLGRELALGNFPATAANNVHRITLSHLMTQEVRRSPVTGKSRMVVRVGHEPSFTLPWRGRVANEVSGVG